MRVGIDASNLRQGGGITHLAQLLAAADPGEAGIERVTVWGAEATLSALPQRPWLLCEEPVGLTSGLARARWQIDRLSRAAGGRVDVLFLPGGTYLGRFRPFVTMFRNMLPFDVAELRRQRSATLRLKMRVLRSVQAATFRRADGVIFLNEYAKEVIIAQVGALRGETVVIEHGLDRRFFAAPRLQSPLTAYSEDRPFRWLYVSAILDYKRPWHVAEAAALLRQRGLPVTVTFLGPGYGASLQRLTETIDRLDQRGHFLRIAPAVAHNQLTERYRDSDAFVFASTCENMPNSLLEAMAAGLPIACADRRPMPDVLRDAGIYFDPERPVSIAGAMEQMMRDAGMRARLSARAYALARHYDWTRTARETFAFLASVAAG
jgi:glycosyltransferase involved in cell wall biosynthesis